MTERDDLPNPPIDGTRDGDGVWRGGVWHPDCLAEPPPPEAMMWRTHHEEGSAEERYSRTMRFEKYVAMQQLLTCIAAAPSEHMMADGYASRAKEILAGMVRPRGPAVRAAERADQLEVIALAYRLASGVAPPVQQKTQEARNLMVEALKAWERAHTPQPIDPLLGP